MRPILPADATTNTESILSSEPRNHETQCFLQASPMSQLTRPVTHAQQKTEQIHKIAVLKRPNARWQPTHRHTTPKNIRTARKCRQRISRKRERQYSSNSRLCHFSPRSPKTVYHSNSNRPTNSTTILLVFLPNTVRLMAACIRSHDIEIDTFSST